MSTATQRSLIAFVEELASVIGDMAGAAVEVSDGEPAAGRCWVATLTADGEGGGTCVATLDADGAAALSRLGSSAEAPVEDAAVADLLRNTLTRAAAALGARRSGERLDLTLTALEPADGPVDGGEAQVRTLTSEALGAPIRLRVAWVEPADAADRERPAATAAVEGGLGSRLDVILDIDLPVVVRFGHTELPIRTLSRLGPGSVIDLGRSPDDPVEVLVSNRVVARGEVVIVGGNYGVRILDVTSHSERVRSMEA